VPPQPGPGRVPRRRGRWFSGRSAAAVLITALSVVVAVAVTPAASAAGELATGFARAVRQLVSPAPTARAFSGTPAVGALFTSSAGQLGSHFCTGTVVASPGGDLVVTAAHCVSGVSGMVFIPDYGHGATPYGVWDVQRVYVDQAWKSSADPDDDVAILQVSQAGSTVPIEHVTGADKLVTGQASRPLVQVIGYPDTADGPVTCQNRTTQPMARQLEFSCGGFTDGTSGGPFLADVDPATGQGGVTGVIGGYEQGGNTPQVSYSSAFGANIAGLYAQAVSGG
jgi:V8-like Glu-specific endopeptidase